jgi:hypothetical protein
MSSKNGEDGATPPVTPSLLVLRLQQAQALDNKRDILKIYRAAAAGFQKRCEKAQLELETLEMKRAFFHDMAEDYKQKHGLTE